MGLKYLPHLALVIALGSGYIMWTNMERTIDRQKLELANKQITIEVMVGNVLVAEQEAKADKANAVFSAVSKLKKEQIEKGLKMDKSKAVPVTSTRFYL